MSKKEKPRLPLGRRGVLVSQLGELTNERATAIAGEPNVVSRNVGDAGRHNDTTARHKMCFHRVASAIADQTMELRTEAVLARGLRRRKYGDRFGRHRFNLVDRHDHGSAHHD